MERNNKILRNEKEKNVGIMTWHYYTNVGSNIQAYALFKTIESFGKKPIFINYRYKRFNDNFIKRFIKETWCIFDRMFNIYNTNKISFKMYQFQKRKFRETKIFFKFDEKIVSKLNNEIQYFVCGSDQIWAPSVFDANYFLPFVKKENCKISYAPSIGLNDIPEELCKEYKELLKNFNNLSVREEKGRELLERIGIQAQVVLDPSFLLKKEDWLSIQNKKIKYENYIFCYFLGDNELDRNVIKKYAKKNNKKIIIYSQNKNDKKISDIWVKRMGPEEFVSFINYADCIFTDSFHGVALSVNLEKKFYTFLRFSKGDKINQNSRIHNILQILGLENRLIISEEYTDEDINYYYVNGILNNKRTESLEYLKKALKVD